MTNTNSSTTREFIADTLALVLFFTLAGALNERFIVGMSWEEVLRARLIGAPLMVLTARPYGIWRSWLMARFAGDGRVSQGLWDSLALLLFQVPIYVSIIWTSGARGGELLLGALGAVAYMFLLGRPYGMFLDWVRALFSLPPGGQKPMSPGG
ncbi:L-alanine exporter [Pseudooceanicola antarcticus]|uniref:L-alanine exporter AlaE n=1 Tax=Pseudooceanicola antarcticus TaxID=1247613 RepID=A0A285I0G4_9RHOB|nr:L-alanine exporter AlaE [Pseudooceanicola antarcticus]SNY41470.1 L-alanine exporter [Pseudooceanicola antarcticus]